MAEKENLNITNIVKTYGNRLFRFIRNKVRSNEDVEEILQDVWFQLTILGNLEDL